MLATSLFTFLASSLLPSHQPFVAEPILLPLEQPALILKHKDRTQSGGFSALYMTPDCKNAWFISDYSQVEQEELAKQPVLRSQWFQTNNEFDDAGRIVNMTVKTSGQLKDLNGKILSGAAESIVSYKNGFLVSLDDRGDLFFYSHMKNDQFSKELASANASWQKKNTSMVNLALSATPVLKIPQKQLGKGNSGLESITQLNTGEIVSIWEKFKLSEVTVPVRVVKSSGEVIDTTYQATSSPKDAETLKSGEVIVMEKDWLGAKGSRLRLALINPEQLKNGRTVTSQTLFDYTSTEYDNFEGMASCTVKGKEWIYLVSDDNGDWPRKDVEDKGRTRQRTLFVGFEVEPLINTLKNK